MSTGDAIPVTERRRLSATHDPHIVIECAGGTTPAIFTKGAWNRTVSNLAIYDDAFIHENLYSGLTVEPEHRQRLHEFVLGEQGVALHRKVEELAERNEAHNAELRTREQKIPATEMHGFPIDKFCALPEVADVDSAILDTERKIAAVREQDPIRKAPKFDAITLPPFDLNSIERVLSVDLPGLETSAAERVKAHVAALGRNGETWLGAGLKFASATGKASECPFCLQDLSRSTIIDHYRSYFSAGYEELKRSVSETLATVNRAHSGDVPAAFERAVRVAVQGRSFWSRFCEVAEVSLDTAEVVRLWREAREMVMEELQAKQSAPLDVRLLPDAVKTAIAEYEAARARVEAVSAELVKANAAINLVKEGAASGGGSALESDRLRLKASKARHTPAIAALCNEYLAEKEDKAKTAALREQARADLDKYRTGIFPKYQQAVNDYLGRFNAGFRIDSIKSVNNKAGTSCNYNVIIDTKPVPVAGGTPEDGKPAFHNTLSAGDRNTLALAFFFASLDQDPNLATKVVVIDDPISSLDDQRSLATVNEVRRLAQRAGQVIVLSHTKKFLARLWEGVKGKMCTAVQIVRDGQGSTLEPWNVSDDAITEYDRRYALLRKYLDEGKGDLRFVAESVRPLLEAYMRVARSAEFTPGDLLGPFLSICDQRLGTPNAIFDPSTITELREIVEYANRFHHDTNPAWETETINDGELQGFVKRALAFVRR